MNNGGSFWKNLQQMIGGKGMTKTASADKPNTIKAIAETLSDRFNVVLSDRELSNIERLIQAQMKDKTPTKQDIVSIVSAYLSDRRSVKLSNDLKANAGTVKDIVPNQTRIKANIISDGIRTQSGFEKDMKKTYAGVISKDEYLSDTRLRMASARNDIKQTVSPIKFEREAHLIEKAQCNVCGEVYDEMPITTYANGECSKCTRCGSFGFEKITVAGEKPAVKVAKGLPKQNTDFCRQCVYFMSDPGNTHLNKCNDCIHFGLGGKQNFFTPRSSQQYHSTEYYPGYSTADTRFMTKQKNKKADDVSGLRKLGFKQEAVAPEGWEGTVKKMKKHPEITNPWALSWSMKNKGYKPGGKKASIEQEADWGDMSEQKGDVPKFNTGDIVLINFEVIKDDPEFIDVVGDDAEKQLHKWQDDDGGKEFVVTEIHEGYGFEYDIQAKGEKDYYTHMNENWLVPAKLEGIAEASLKRKAGTELWMTEQGKWWLLSTVTMTPSSQLFDTKDEAIDYAVQEGDWSEQGAERARSKSQADGVGSPEKFATSAKKESPKQRLEYLRKQIQNENISFSELAELQSLQEYIEPGDVLLLEWAGKPEFPEDEGSKETTSSLKTADKYDVKTHYVDKQTFNDMTQAQEFASNIAKQPEIAAISIEENGTTVQVDNPSMDRGYRPDAPTTNLTTMTSRKLNLKTADVLPSKDRTYSIQCPECDNIFEAEEDKVGKEPIKCPKCGATMTGSDWAVQE